MADASRSGRVIGRYVLHGEIAAGGMATVHLGRLLGPAGFSRTVAIKRLHPQFAKDPEFVSMFLDEARLAARVRHPNVVSVLDVVAKEGELFLVMDYIQGESLARLLREATALQEALPLPVAVGIVSGALRGLHAAHEATSEQGDPLGLVHRDVSPHNVLVGVDGVPSVVDFGVAKASNRFQTTREGQLKGKLGYMAPEQIRLERVDRRTDVYAAAVVLWECITGRRLFAGDDAAGVLTVILDGRVPAPSSMRKDLDPALDAIVLRGLNPDPNARFATAKEMAVALEEVLPAASPAKVGEWVEHVAGEALLRRREQVAAVESASSLDAEREMSRSNLAEAATWVDLRSDFDRRGPEPAARSFDEVTRRDVEGPRRSLPPSADEKTDPSRSPEPHPRTSLTSLAPAPVPASKLSRGSAAALVVLSAAVAGLAFVVATDHLTRAERAATPTASAVATAPAVAPPGAAPERPQPDTSQPDATRGAARPAAELSAPPAATTNGVPSAAPATSAPARGERRPERSRGPGNAGSPSPSEGVGFDGLTRR
jgi:serine/threonine-protein kinase